ncbi:MAG: AAA family ATPase [Pseudomonadota bacterium]
MARLISSAFDPVRADPRLFVDRDDLRGDLEETLEDLVLSRRFQARLTITGDKGVGKTILTRTVLHGLHERLGRSFLLVEVDGRGLTYRPFLERLARALTEEGLGWLATNPEPDHDTLERWFKELALLAIHSTITEAETSSIARAYGANAGVEGGLLGALQLKALFNWTETRQLGQAVHRSREVTDQFLHAAVQATLVRLMERGVSVVLFLNDLDQALNRENPALLRQALGQMVALEPCIQILNVRSEILYDDLRRESDLRLVPPMSAEALLDLFDRRIQEEPSAEKRARLQAPELRRVVAWLAAINGNPFAFLSWLQHYLRLFEEPWPSLDRFEDRHQIVVRSGVPNDADLVRRLIEITERVSTGSHDWCSREALLRGALSVDSRAARGLSSEEVAKLVNAGALIPRDVFTPDLGLRLEPLLDLLRTTGPRE